jgi:lysophospholipase L1-like esterase
LVANMPMSSRLAVARCALAQAGLLLSASFVRRVRSGMHASKGQIERHAVAWEESNVRASRGSGLLWVALGDSTAQGVGAAAYDGGYVGQLLSRLREDGLNWRVINLSVSGARAAGVIHEQIPRLEALSGSGQPDLVTCAVGANDLIHTPLRLLESRIREIIRRLPPGSIIANMPQGLGRRRARRINALIDAEAPAWGQRVANVWSHTGPPWQGSYSQDFFHPNEKGYAQWAAAFADALNLCGSDGESASLA